MNEQPNFGIMNNLFSNKWNVALCLHPVCSQPVSFSSSPLLLSSPALQQELLKPWQVLFFFFATCCSFGSARFCLCLSVCLSVCVSVCLSVDWPSMAGLFICAYLHEWLVMLVFFPIFRKEEKSHECTHNAHPLLFIFNSQINSSPDVLTDFNFSPGHLVATLVCLLLMSFFLLSSVMLGEVPLMPELINHKVGLFIY